MPFNTEPNIGQTELERMIRDLQIRIAQIARTADTGWITPTLINGWTASSTTPQYRRLNGITYLRGTFAATGSLATAAFQLPVGFRNGAGLRIANWANAASAVCGIYIDGSGNVIPYWSGGVEPSIDGISFIAEA